MKIDTVITAGNINHHYLQLFPLIKQVWIKRFNINPLCILIADNIPDYLIEHKDNIILFPPIQGINDIFVAQVIRLLYPALLPDNTIITSDLDIIPVKKQYFIDSIQNIPDDTFITFTDRYVHLDMYALCFNVAKGSTFKKIFNINNIQDIINTIKLWYHPEYIGRKNCPGWYTDQKQLFIHFNNYNGNKICLKDSIIGFNRLNNRQRDKERIVTDFKNVLNNLEQYSDIHCIKPFRKTGSYIKKIIKKLLENY